MLFKVKLQVIQTIRISTKFSLFLLSHALSLSQLFFKFTVFPYVLSELHQCTWPELHFQGLERKYRFWSWSPNKMLHIFIYFLRIVFYLGGGYWPTLKLPKFYVIKTMRRKGSLHKSVFNTMVAKDKSTSWMLLSTGSIFKVIHSNNLNFQAFKNYIYGAHRNYTFLTPIPRYILFLLNPRLCSEILVNMPSYT